MGILLEKGNKEGNIVNFENYSEVLKFEMLEYFSCNISNFIQNNNYQAALSYVENNVEKKFEIPLKTDISFHSNNSINKLIINEKAKFINFFCSFETGAPKLQKILFYCKFYKIFWNPAPFKYT